MQSRIMIALNAFLIFSIGLVACSAQESCDVSQDEISAYKPIVDEITKAVTEGPYKNLLYDSLTQFVDRFGNRMTGTPVLEHSIQYLSNLSTTNGFKPVLEPVKIPVWIRGKESASIITQYRKRKLRIKGLGFSPSGNLTAELFVVKDFEELQKNAAQVAGKIVLFNAEFVDYPSTVPYRNTGPAEASKLGAVAALVRSITPFSIGSYHAGVTYFDNGTKPIPAAAVTLEDADMLARLFYSNETVSIHLKMNHTINDEGGESSNLINDLTGAAEPESYVTISGHIDSWDVGQGALDDGGGAFLALHTVFLLKSLNISTPKRTIRSILWTGEEIGLVGANSYAKTHAEELKNWTVAFESDEGLFNPLGLKLKGSDQAKCVLESILKLFSDVNMTEITTGKSVGSDITVFQPHGVPLIEPLMDENNYFWFHHTEGDSMRTLNSTIMDKHLILAAGVLYILADLSKPLPRNVTEVKEEEMKESMQDVPSTDTPEQAAKIEIKSTALPASESVQSESEPETRADSSPEPIPDSRSESSSKSELEARLDLSPEPVPETRSESSPEPVLKSRSELSPKSELEARSDLSPKSVPETRSESSPKDSVQEPVIETPPKSESKKNRHGSHRKRRN